MTAPTTSCKTSSGTEKANISVTRPYKGELESLAVVNTASSTSTGEIISPPRISIEQPETGLNIAQLLFSLCLVFTIYNFLAAASDVEVIIDIEVSQIASIKPAGLIECTGVDVGIGGQISLECW